MLWTLQWWGHWFIAMLHVNNLVIRTSKVIDLIAIGIAVGKTVGIWPIEQSRIYVLHIAAKIVAIVLAYEAERLVSNNGWVPQHPRARALY